MVDYSYTIGEKVLYQGEECTILNLSWIAASIELPSGKEKIVFKAKLRKVNKKK